MRRVKLELDWCDTDLRVRYRVYEQRNTSFTTYVAKIRGPHPVFRLDREFISCWVNSNPRWSRYVCLLDRNGVYEIVTKRFDREGKYLSRDRKWLIVQDGIAKEYDDQEINDWTILQNVWLLADSQKVAV